MNKFNYLCFIFRVINLKYFYLSIPIILLFLIGCSSTYKVIDYSSYEKFYEDFNNSVKDTKLSVTLTNDSSLVFPEGAEIKNDSIYLKYYPNYYPLNLKLKNDKYFPLTDIKKVSYRNHWKGILPGFYSGLFSGGFIGGILFNYKEGGNHPQKDWGTSIFMGAFYGMIVGVIVGTIIGWENIYQFNH